jgi:subtilisin family serine protease
VARIFFHVPDVILVVMVRSPLHRAFGHALLLALCAAAGGARAQLRLPGALPSLPPVSLPVPGVNTPPLPSLADSNGTLQTLRARVIGDLLRAHPVALETDPAGEPMVRGELLLVSPAQATLDAARAAGFVQRREQVLEELDLKQVVLSPPAGLSTAEGIARLRALDPQLVVDFHHVYTRGGSIDVAPSSAQASASAATAIRVGLIDSGVDSAHPSLRHATIHAWGCGDRASRAALASAHGTAVASLLIGRDQAFAGSAPGATLYAADVYCNGASGGSVGQVAQALAWMARERVGVINVSLVGPRNAMLEAAVRALVVRGHLVVAAVGNDGPAAPPLFPASYPQVIGVTGVSPQRRALPEAARGPQVVFAAPGSDLAAARAGAADYAVARGTSFAAPLVAGLLAALLPTPDRASAENALLSLMRAAVDVGAPGRDDVYGWGVVAESARTVPARLQVGLRR